MIRSLLLVAIGLFVAPLVGGVLAGLDRKLTARLQCRQGPPLLQPFHDLLKLLAKTPQASNPWIGLCATIYLFAAASSVVLFLLGFDLLYIFFVQAVGAIFFAAGALSVPSPYSQIGGQRELLQILAYEPILIMAFAAIYMETGSFHVAAIFAQNEPLLFKLPLVFVAVGLALTIKLRKSPFDISGSHHAHQELVRGVHTEYSGPFLALTELAHWYETMLIMGVCSLFWASHWAGIVFLPLAAYAAEIFVDNVTARLTWRWMLISVLASGFFLTLTNMVWLRLG